MSAGRDTMDPEGRLGARLRAIEFPESAGLSLRVLDRHRSWRERRSGPRPGWPRLAAIAAAVLLLLLASAIAVPGGRQALAAAPLVGPVAQSLLRFAGLDSASDRVTPLEGQAVSSGYTVDLRGGYADNLRTVVILHLDPAAKPQGLVTMDQPHGSPLTGPLISTTAEGDVVLVFGPIADPSPQGNALALHFNEVGQTFGEWTLHLSLTVDASAAAPAPPPGKIGELSVRFTVAVVGHNVEVSTDLSGVPVWQLYDFANEADAGKGTKATPGPGRIYITFTDGSSFGAPRMNAARDAWRYGSTPTELIYDAAYSVPEPGVYVLIVGWRGHSLVRFITVR